MPLVLSLYEAVDVVHHAHYGVHVFLGEHIDCLRRGRHRLQFLLCSPSVDWVEQASHQWTASAMLQSGVARLLIQSVAKEHRSTCRILFLRLSSNRRLRLSRPLLEPLCYRLYHFLIYRCLFSLLSTYSSFSAQARLDTPKAVIFIFYLIDESMADSTKYY